MTRSPRHPLRALGFVGPVALVAGLFGLVVFAACLGDIEVGPPSEPVLVGGGGGAAGEGGSLTGGGAEGCVSPPDGFCNEESDCSCSACALAAACTDGGCMANGYCDLAFEDSCVCSDCDWDQACIGASGGGNCTDDGTCEREVESCACADCAEEPTCQDNHGLCAGGQADGFCDPASESCSCSDCLGAFACLCTQDDYCSFDEPCVCLDCWSDSFCSSDAYCTDDGSCDWLFEGCACADCAGLTLCDGFP